MVTKGNKKNHMKMRKGFEFFSPPLSTIRVSFCTHENCKKPIILMLLIHAGLEPILFFEVSTGSAGKKLTFYSFVTYYIRQRS